MFKKHLSSPLKKLERTVIFLKHFRKPSSVTLLDFVDKEWPPRGYKPMQTHLFIMGLNEYPLRPLSKTASETTKKAYSFLYPGFQTPGYVHLASKDKLPLHTILTQIMRARNIIMSYEDWEPIRLTLGYISMDEKRVVPSGFDSRNLWPTLDPQEVNFERLPHDVPMLNQEIFEDLCRSEIDCFLNAIGIKGSLVDGTL